MGDAHRAALAMHAPKGEARRSAGVGGVSRGVSSMKTGVSERGSVTWPPLAATVVAGNCGAPSASVGTAGETVRRAAVVGRETVRATGGRGVAGIPATLAAINQGRVWKLIYLQGLKLEGGSCASCQVLVDPVDERCPLCGTKAEPELHFVDRMARSVLERGGHVEIVDGPAAEALRQVAEVAAILRS